jgi:serine/threonine protein kinase
MADTDEELMPRRHSGSDVRQVAIDASTRRYTDGLIHMTAEMVEVIWPLETDDCVGRNTTILPLKAFISEALRRSRSSYSTLQVTLYYLVQVKGHVPDPDMILQNEDPDRAIQMLGSGRRVFLAALIVASKYLQDRNYSARAWSKICGLSTREINEIERAFLGALNWKLFVSPFLWKRWTDILIEKCMPTVDSNTTLEDLAFSEWKAAVGSLTPDLKTTGVEETSRGQNHISWAPQPRVTFHSELERRSLLLKPLVGSASSVRSNFSELASRFSGLTLDSFATSATYRTAQSSYTTASIATYATALGAIHEGPQSTNIGDEDQRVITSAYLKALQDKNLILGSEIELNWSGKGQHVEFPAGVTVPLEHIDNLGSSASAIVDRVRCKRILVARKMMRCPRKWAQVDALNEVEHLQWLRHAHIVQLVGTYVQNRTFAVLMYPAADFDLRKFMEDTNDLRTSSPEAGSTIHPGTEYSHRLSALASFPGCLANALAFIHSRTTKHADIKPANVLVKSRATEVASNCPQHCWRVYIADFGLSRNFSSENSQTDGPTARTPRYCAPEVYLYESRGRAADVFSMGCVFTEILTVYAGYDLEDLREYLCSDGGTDHYHYKIDCTRSWIKGKISDMKPPGPGKEALLDYVQMMLEEIPMQRPTAASLKTFFQLPLLPPSFRSNEEGCCDIGPEPYIVE